MWCADCGEKFLLIANSNRGAPRVSRGVRGAQAAFVAAMCVTVDLQAYQAARFTAFSSPGAFSGQKQHISTYREHFKALQEN
jgi:hypothetical protein